MEYLKSGWEMDDNLQHSCSVSVFLWIAILYVLTILHRLLQFNPCRYSVTEVNIGEDVTSIPRSIQLFTACAVQQQPNNNCNVFIES